MRTPILLTAALLGSMTLAQSASAFETAKAGNMIGNLNSTYAGLEVAVPNFKLNDSNLDGYPETITVKFDVYSLGTTTKRYSTAAKTWNTPPLGSCNPATATDHVDFEQIWSGRATNGTRLTLVMEMVLDCGTDYSSRVVVYSANVGAANGAAWVYNSPNDYGLVAADGIDISNPADGVNDNLALIMSEDTASGPNSRVIRFNFSNGTVVSNNSYLFVR